MINYLSSEEFAEKCGMCPSHIRVLIAARRIPGVIRVGRKSIIPEDAELPKYGDTTTYEFAQWSYLSLSEFQEKTGASKARIRKLCESGELEGVIRVGNRLYFPDTCELPPDKRLKSGQYIGWRKLYGANKDRNKSG